MIQFSKSITLSQYQEYHSKVIMEAQAMIPLWLNTFKSRHNQYIFSSKEVCGTEKLRSIQFGVVQNSVLTFRYNIADSKRFWRICWRL